MISSWSGSYISYSLPGPHKFTRKLYGMPRHDAVPDSALVVPEQPRILHIGIPHQPVAQHLGPACCWPLQNLHQHRTVQPVHKNGHLEDSHA